MNDLTFTRRELRNLTVPLILEQLLVFAVGLADSLMVAGVSNAAVSAVSLVDSVSALIIAVFTAFAAGGAVVAGQAIGRQDAAMGRDAAQQLVVALGVSALAVTAGLYLGRGFILGKVFGKVEADVALATRQYYNIVMLSVPMIALYNAGTALLRMMERSDITFKVSMLMNGINIVGNAALIYGFGMGVVGAAIPTLVSRAVAMIVILFLLTKERFSLNLRGMRYYRFHWQTVKSILSIGVPSGIENGMFYFGRLMLTSLISTLGTASITANAIGNSIGNFHVCCGTAVGLALTTVASQCIGAGRYDRAREYTRQLMKQEYFIQALVNSLLLLAMPLICRAYHVTGETARLSCWVMGIHAVASIFIHATSFTLPNTLRAAGDARYTMLVSSFSMWLCRVGLGYVFALSFRMGVIGVYTSHALDWVVRSAAFMLRYQGHKWEHDLQR